MDSGEKAKELVEKFYSVNDDEIQDIATNPYISRGYAKQCALIAIDEIIHLTKFFKFRSNIMDEYTLSYWQKVKKEIEKIA